MTDGPHFDLVKLGGMGLFDTMAKLYMTRDSAVDLFSRAGVPVERLPVFGEPVLSVYWRTVFARVNDGLDVPGGPMAIIEAALQDFPLNEVLLRIVIEVRGRPTPSVRVVLCLMASPSDSARIRLEVEYRELRAIAAASGGRLVVEQSMATRVTDIIPELLNLKIDILHFAGHGTADGKLKFEDGNGHAAEVSIEVLSDVLSAVGPIECAVMSSCFSGSYTRPLLKAATYAIGSTTPLLDSCATLFVSSFYRALAMGRDVPDAFAVARAGLGLRDECGITDMRLELDSPAP